MSRFLTLLLVLALAGCTQQTMPGLDLPGPSEPSPDDVMVPGDFDFSMESDVNVSLSLLSNDDAPVSGALVAVSRIDDGVWHEIRRGISDPSGQFMSDFRIPKAGSEVGIAVMYPGFPDSIVVEPQSSIRLDLGGSQPAHARTGEAMSKGGAWDSQGVPYYLMPQRDQIDAGLLATVSASLPEGRPVPQYNSHYLGGVDTDLHITETADVWITFVHEGAGWKNALGFYTYQTGNPPRSEEEIGSKNMLFPNVSYAGSGGGLQSGDKIHLGRFSAGTSISWFMVSNGWNPRSASVGRGNYTVYSRPELNPEKDPSKRQHAILLNDVDRELMLVGFEDVNREWGWCDNDFNDAIFYVTASPYRAITSSNTRAVTDPGKDPNADADNDGVLNAQDEDPYDANKAFVSYEPGQGVYGSLIFEDLWPVRGDYDFNDMVLDYNTRYVTNARGDVSSMTVEFVIRAMGAGYRNGLGFQLPVAPSRIKSVSGQSLSRGYANVASNGTESGQSKAVIIAFENGYDILPAPGGFFANTQPEAPSVGSGSMSVTIEFHSPVSKGQIGTAPYNIFLIPGGNRSVEIHLPGWQPTDLANRGMLGSGDDAAHSGRPYMTETGLPWAMHVPRTFSYPRENAPITKAHKHFRRWAESGGSEYNDWYLDKTGYRSVGNIY